MADLGRPAGAHRGVDSAIESAMLSRRSFLHSTMLGLAACRRTGPAARETLEAERVRRRIPGAAVAVVARGAP
ncbi:MAG TPA: hypothetical protein VF469_37685, partial [Kofleriaceae bacterium]